MTEENKETIICSNCFFPFERKKDDQIKNAECPKCFGASDETRKARRKFGLTAKRDREEREQKIKELELVEIAFQTLVTSPSLRSQILDELDKTVKYDVPLKNCVLATVLSCLIDPINLSVKSPSSQGKTYGTTQTLEFIPKEQKIILAGMTPKSLVYDHGILKDQEGKEINPEDKPTKPNRRMYGQDIDRYKWDQEHFKADCKAWRERTAHSYYEIDLRWKVLVLLEPPSYETMMFLKVIMSHDEFITLYKLVNKSSKGTNVTTTVALKGWPSTIILGTDNKHIEEYSTRSLNLTPDSNIEKIKEANKLTNERACYPFRFKKDSVRKQAIKKLFQEIRDIVINEEIKVIFPFPDFYQKFTQSAVRDMRDFQHFIQFIKTFTLLRLFQRAIIEIDNDKYVITTKEDIEEAITIFEKIIETTRTNTEERILQFYKIIFLEKPDKKSTNQQQLITNDEEKEGITVEQAVRKHNQGHKKPLSDHYIRKWFKRLNKIGYVEIRPHPTDKRRNLYYSLIDNVENTVFSEMTVFLTSEIKKDCEHWLREICTANEFPRLYNVSSYDNNTSKLTEISLSKEELIQNICNLNRLRTYSF